MNQREKDIQVAKDEHGLVEIEPTFFADGAAYGRKDMLDRLQRFVDGAHEGDYPIPYELTDWIAEQREIEGEP